MESFTTELFTTTKNRPSLVVNGYQHRVFYSGKSTITWKCTKQKKDKCRGLVRTDLNNIVLKMTPHCCVTNAEEIEMKKTVEKLKKRVRDDIHRPICEIFKKEISGLDYSEKLRYRSMKKNLSRIRKEVLRQKLNSCLPDNTEESNSLLPNGNPEQVECSVDPSQLMEENICENLQASDTYETLQFSVDIEKNQCRDGQFTDAIKNLEILNKRISLDEIKSKNSRENSAVPPPNQLLKQNNEKNNCQVVQVFDDPMNASKMIKLNSRGQDTDTRKNLEILNKRISSDEIKSKNSCENSAVRPPNQLLEQNNGKNGCQVMQVINEPMNASKKRKLNSLEEQIEEVHSMLLPDTMKKDEFHVFGDYVASELRKLSPRALTLAKHNINNILFQANFGNYDSPSTSRS